MKRSAMAIVFALVQASCAAAPAPAASDSFDENGEFTETYNANNISSIDPQKLSFTDEVRVAELVYEPLLSLDPTSLLPAPGGADLPAVSADGRVYRFTLRADLAYSDGAPVKASDYAFGLSRLCDPTGLYPYASSLHAIQGCADWSALDATKTSPDQLAAAQRELMTNGIVVLGDRSLELRLREPAPYLLSVLALWFATPVRRAEVERYGQKWWQDPANYIGNGPFVLSEWILNSNLVFERNPHYRTRPKVKRITLRAFDTNADALAAYQAGTIDRVNNANDAELIRNVTAAHLDKELSVTASSCTLYIRLNHARPPFDDPKVRLALAKSIDREAYAREIRPYSRAATSFIPGGMPGNDPTDDAQSYDLNAARRLLSESRYAGTAALHDLVWPLASTAKELARQEAAWIVSQWQAIGVDVRVEIVDLPTLANANRAIGTRALFARGAWCADYPDPADWLSQWFPSTAQKGVNDFGYRDSSVDTLLAEADRTIDPAKRADLYLKASRLISSDVGFIWLTYNQSVSLIKPWVGGLDYSGLDWGGVFHPADLFVRKH